MSRSTERVDTLLRVRRIQQQQAAMGLADRLAEVAHAQARLEAARDEYRSHDHLDRPDTATPTAGVLVDRARRARHAAAIPRRKQELAASEAALEAQRAEIAERTGAVRGIERLGDRLRDSENDELLRRERVEIDELARRIGARP